MHILLSSTLLVATWFGMHDTEPVTEFLPAITEVLEKAAQTGDFKTAQDFSGPYEVYAGKNKSGEVEAYFTWIRFGDSLWVKKVGDGRPRLLDQKEVTSRTIAELPKQFWFRVRAATGQTQSNQLIVKIRIGESDILAELYEPNAKRLPTLAPDVKKSVPIKKAQKKRNARRRNQFALRAFFTQSITVQ